MDTVIIFCIILVLGPKTIRKLNIKIKPIKAIIVVHFIVGLIILILSFILYDLLPPQEIIKGKSLPILPAFLGLITLISGIFLIFKKPNRNVLNLKRWSSFYGWFFYSLTWLLIIISKYGLLFSIYSPSIYNSETSIPDLGLWIYVCGTSLSGVTLYYCSYIRNTKYPDIFLWISLMTILYSIYQTTLYSLLFSHGLVKDFNCSYPNYASLIILGYLPMIIVMFLLSFRDKDLNESGVQITTQN